jgi:hypothetical protein
MHALRPHRRSSPSRAHASAGRSGIATVEFAILIPLFLMLVLGMTEMGHAFQVSADLTAAVREGGRMASMDLSKVTPSTMTLNQKVIKDMRNFLTASGIPGDDVTLTITHASTEAVFDLGDEDNYLKSFRISASIPYAKVSRLPADYMNGRTIRFSAVYRLGRSQVTN